MSKTVEAAGAILIRIRSGKQLPISVSSGDVLSDEDFHALSDCVEVCLVHRPKYDDWSWPKGKQEQNESLFRTAVREVGEETGTPASLGPFLTTLEYPLNEEGGRKRKGVSGSTTKRVSYWMATPLDALQEQQRHVAFGPVHEADISEINDVRWTSISEARHMLTHSTDRTVLDACVTRLRESALDAISFTIVRHGKAEPRKSWIGTDAVRPLTPLGAAASFALSRELACFAPARIVSSSWTRCADTVLPYALQSGIPLERNDDFTEDAYKTHHQTVLDALESCIQTALQEKRNTLLCTHRPLFEGIFENLRGMCLGTSLAKRLPKISPFMQTAHALNLSVVNSAHGPIIIDIQKVAPIVY
ncbi:NUDIX hydrolase [Bifidobacterium sp.]|jgi:8-oxo-dGTP diphosphatase|uniref:NUDIX hydrolase n=1 Tax=Bifidobacterium sp. TaxID=41200 RepID=UPI0025BC1616|nr:NUDIX hydrolase [Bifidobacterium sp.]MCI1635013.1 NUDIX hydrolase [Bifidobacterium sp.]